ncbi:MAG: acyl-CoA thioesterase [Gemmatimonadaceae bacterium]|nr:acyl-CoA thioesterase [Gemmatimonadaceae bacterium]MDQ3516818.1 acyl-CoA thioesterase [Gemmatimonadota bacterium]
MRFPLETRYPDYDTKGHVNNATFLTFFEMARGRAWVDVMGQPVDPDFILAEANVRYVSEAMIGEQLDIEITTTEVRTKAWVWSYAVRSVSDGRLVAEGRTVQVMFDYADKRPIPISEEVRKGLALV